MASERLSVKNEVRETALESLMTYFHAVRELRVIVAGVVTHFYMFICMLSYLSERGLAPEVQNQVMKLSIKREHGRYIVA